MRHVFPSFTLQPSGSLSNIMALPGRLFPALLLLLSMPLTANPTQAGAFPDLTELVKDVSPAVVNITAIRNTKSLRRYKQSPGQQVPDFFKHFFDSPQHGPQRRSAPSSKGSGFIVSPDGYILTNHHVVENAAEILVALSDRRQRVAQVIGTDPASDLALLKIDADNLPTINIGNSSGLEVGEWVVAIGSPFDFGLSVTAGIVSAKGRNLPEDGDNGAYVPYIQTDVAINPGNSGGPLIDLNGQVVGINSRIFTHSGGFMGLSFAIPIDVAMEVVEQLKEKGHVSRGWLGVSIQSVDRDLAESFGLERAAGALVTQIFADSPAEQSDLAVGDIIVAFDGKPIDLSYDLPHLVGRVKPDTRVNLVVYREGKRKNLQVAVGLLPEHAQRKLASASQMPGNRLGLNVATLSPEQQEALDANQGLLIVSVAPGPAREANLRKGDVITRIDGDSMTSIAVFNRKVKDLPVNKAIHVRIIRHGHPAFRVIKIKG